MANELLEKYWQNHWKSGPVASAKMRYSLREIEVDSLDASEKLNYIILANIYNLSIFQSKKLELEVISFFRDKTYSEKELILINYFKDAFSEAFLTTLDASINFELSKLWNFVDLSKNFSNFSANHLNSLKSFLSNREGVKLVLFLRKDRNYKGRLVLIDDQGQVKDDWSLEALCKGRENKPFYVTNGQTPCGVYSIDSVMPKADQQELFGKFRRLKLEFISKEELSNQFDEILLEHHFWKEGAIANLLGRSLLRIHGTGLTNKKFFKPYYPMITTSGCVSMNEAKEANDQRQLLDKLMTELKLDPIFENEEKIHGTLCVVELDEKKSHVSMDEIKKLNQ